VSAALDVVQRLALSRQRLRLALAVQRTGSDRAAAAATGVSDAWSAIPGLGVLFDSLRGWWAKHPLRPALMLALQATQSAVAPLAQRHPIALVTAALVAGAALAWSRPWRWLLSPALLAGLMPQLLSTAMARVPGPAWLAVLASLVKQPPPAPPAHPPAPVPAPAP
jgi:hypothetical protein